MGLASLQVAEEALGDKVRGSAAAHGSTGGLSFVSGMLYDPSTGSNARATSTQQSSALTDSIGAFPTWNWPTRPAQAMQASGLNFGFTVGSGGQPTFAGSVFGLATGYGIVGH